MARLAVIAWTLSASLRDESDEALMLRYQRGEVRAFEELLGRHRGGVYNFLLRSVRDRAAAEDLLQEVFLRIIKGMAEYQKQAKFTTWLYTIARNLCIDAARRAKHRRAASLDAPTGDDERGATMGDRIADRGPGVDRQVVGKELGGKLEAAIARLPEDQREVFLLREVHDLPFKEIAVVVGCAENTVKSRMRYALEKLREELEEYADVAKVLP